jgi:hypothetical protein
MCTFYPQFFQSVSYLFVCNSWGHLILRARKLNLGVRLSSPLSVDSSVNNTFCTFRPYCTSISEPETKTPFTIPSSSSASPLGLRTCSNLLSVYSVRRALSGWEINLDAPKPKNNTELNVSAKHIIVWIPCSWTFCVDEHETQFRHQYCFLQQHELILIFAS